MKKLLQKYKSIPYALKAGLWFVACSFIQKGMNIITIPIFSRMLTPDEYGMVSVYISWMTIFQIFTTLNLFYGTYNAGMNKFDNDREGYTSAIQGLIITIWAGTFAIYLIFHNWIDAWLKLPTVFMIAMFLEMFARSGLYLWSTRERFLFRYRPMIVATIAVFVGSPLITILFMYLSRNRMVARVFVQAITMLVFCSILIAINIAKGKKFFDKTYWKFGLLFAIPLIPHYLSTVVLSQSDRIMIRAIHGEAEAGFYNIAYSAAMAITFLTTAVSQSYGPWLFDKIKSGKFDGIKKVTNSILLMGGIVIFILIVFAPEAVKILSPAEYHTAIWAIPPIAASVFFQLIYQLISNVEFYYLKNKFILVASLIVAIMNIILNFIFIPIYGMMAAGYTTLACYILYAMLHYWCARRICLKELGVNIFDGRTMLLMSAVIVIAAILLNFTYGFAIIRYLIVIAIIIIIYIKRCEIVNIIRNLWGDKKFNGKSADEELINSNDTTKSY